MPAIRPLSVMLWVLGYAAAPCWPAGIASAVLWTARAEVALLSVASTGTFSVLTLLMLRRARDRAEADERRARELAAHHEVVAGLLCGAIVGDLRPARTPGLRVVPPAAPRGGAPAQR
jgi:hypothetical protein